MKQILQSYRTGELWLADVPAPMCDAQSVLVQTSHSVVSPGTERMLVELAQKSLFAKARSRPDLVKKVLQKIRTEGLATTLQKTFAKLDTPISLGYSASGIVVEVGSQVHEFRPGDRVACGGAGAATHAEFNAVPRNLCAKLPAGVTFEDAAFTTIGAIALQGVRQADVRLGENVVVLGLGLLGLISVQILKASGCRVLGIDLDPERARLAKELGADATAVQDTVAQALAFSGGRGVDTVLLLAATTSNQPIEDAAAMLRQRGRVVVVGSVGMNVPRDPFYKKELELRLSMSYGPGRYDQNYEQRGLDYPIGYVRWTEQRNFEAFLDLVAQGRVTPQRFVTHRFPIDDGLQAYEVLKGERGKYLAITLSYPQPADLSFTAAIPRKVPLPAPAPASARNTAAATAGTVRVGLLGAGNYAKSVLLPLLKAQPGVILRGIATATGMSAAETGKKAGFAYATTSPDELLADPEIDALVVCTRHDTHADYLCRALRANKHVLLEKPLCIHQDELTRIEQTLQELGPARPIFTVGYNRRFSPHTVMLREFFTGRATPMVISYRVNAGRVPDDSWLQHPEEGGGRLLGEACHFVDWCRHVVGAPIDQVHAVGRTGSSAEHPGSDATVVTLTFHDGSLGSIVYVCDGAVGLPKERIEVHAAGRSAVLEDFTRTRFFGRRHKDLSTAQQKGQRELLASFFAALRLRRDPIPAEELLEGAAATLRALAVLRGRA